MTCIVNRKKLKNADLKYQLHIRQIYFMSYTYFVILLLLRVTYMFTRRYREVETASCQVRRRMQSILRCLCVRARVSPARMTINVNAITLYLRWSCIFTHVCITIIKTMWIIRDDSITRSTTRNSCCTLRVR